MKQLDSIRKAFIDEWIDSDFCIKPETIKTKGFECLPIPGYLETEDLEWIDSRIDKPLITFGMSEHYQWVESISDCAHQMAKEQNHDLSKNNELTFFYEAIQKLYKMVITTPDTGFIIFHDPWNDYVLMIGNSEFMHDVYQRFDSDRQVVDISDKYRITQEPKLKQKKG